ALDATALWRAHVRYIGAGAVTMGGILSLAGVAPTIARAAREGIVAARDALRRRTAPGRGRREAAPAVSRTDRDLPGWVLPATVTVAALALWLVPSFGLGPLEALFAIVFSGF